MFVLVNGNTYDQINRTRGLRQGDPLSPYLFILASEGLTRLVNEASHHKNLHDIKIARKAPPITHLMFVNDNVSWVCGNGITIRIGLDPRVPGTPRSPVLQATRLD